jgi:hypothetical protein
LLEKYSYSVKSRSNLGAVLVGVICVADRLLVVREVAEAIRAINSSFVVSVDRDNRPLRHAVCAVIDNL